MARLANKEVVAEEQLHRHPTARHYRDWKPSPAVEWDYYIYERPILAEDSLPPGPYEGLLLGIERLGPR